MSDLIATAREFAAMLRDKGYDDGSVSIDVFLPIKAGSKSGHSLLIKANGTILRQTTFTRGIGVEIRRARKMLRALDRRWSDSDVAATLGISP